MRGSHYRKQVWNIKERISMDLHSNKHKKNDYKLTQRQKRSTYRCTNTVTRVTLVYKYGLRRYRHDYTLH